LERLDVQQNMRVLDIMMEIGFLELDITGSESTLKEFYKVYLDASKKLIPTAKTYELVIRWLIRENKDGEVPFSNED
jgi:hypothetical protein